MKAKVNNLMKKDNRLFVCGLANLNGSKNQCIGIDCKLHLIYDAVDLKEVDKG